MTYTDEQGNVHVAVRDTGAQVQRDKSGNVTDVTFPNYRPPAKDPLAERLMQEQTPEYLERARSEGSHRPVLGQEPLPGAGRLANAYKQLMTPGIDDESLRWLGRRDYYKDTPGNFLRNLLVAAENAPGRSISSALSGLNAPVS